jgi:hypothetical protein
LPVVGGGGGGGGSGGSGGFLACNVNGGVNLFLE